MVPARFSLHDTAQRSRWGLAGLAAFVVSGVAFNVLAYRHAHALLHYSGIVHRTASPSELSGVEKLRVLANGVDNPRPTDTRTPRHHGLDYSSHQIPVAAGVTLGAWFIEHPQPVGGALLFHGYAAAKSSLLPEAAAFHDRGYSVLLVDFRGSGDSSGSTTTLGHVEAQDVRAAVAFSASRLNLSRPVLYGHSMGGVAVLRAFSLGELAVSGVILVSVFDELINTVKGRFHTMGLPAAPSAHALLWWGGLQADFWPFAHDPVTYAAHCSVPTLLLRGSQDILVTESQAHAVFLALPGPKLFSEIGGAGHDSLLASNPSHWDTAIDSLLRLAPH